MASVDAVYCAGEQVEEVEARGEAISRVRRGGRGGRA